MITKPMLAGKADMSRMRYPALVSPKLDGIRAIVKDKTVLSRNMEPIRNRHVQSLFGRPQFEGFDGELIVGDPTSKDAMRNTGAVMAFDGKPNVRYYVFDDYAHDGTFLERYRRVQGRVSRAKTGHVIAVTHELIHTEAELVTFEEQWLAMGYEGLMVRCPRGRYKQGRSTTSEGWLLKVKRFEDTEAVILDVQEMNHNDNEATTSATGRSKRSTMAEGLRAAGVLGSLLVRNLDGGETFNIGSGFTAAQRSLYWMRRTELVGKIVKYRFFPTGSKDRPRFPTFLGFRDPSDMS